MKPAARVLVFDIETSLAIYAAYPSNKPQFLSAENMLQDWFMICVGWQWEGSSKVNSVSVLDDPKRFKRCPTDDYHVVKRLHQVISEADAIVGHNMQRFDWKKFLSRVIYHKLPPLPQPKIIDTLKEVKRAAFSHNKLSFINKKLSISEKLHHDYDMWLKILNGDAKAVRNCVKYCRGDITSTMELYLRLKPYMPSGSLPNQNLWRADGIECCRACSGEEINKRGTRTTRTGKYQMYQCKDCGAWMQGRKSLKSVNIR